MIRSKIIMPKKKQEKDKLNNASSSLAIPEINGSALTSLMHKGIGLESPFMKDIYLRKQAIVGTRFLGGSDELVDDLEVGSRISFLREQDNAFDSNAIMALDEQGRKLGYIPRRENELIGALMAAGKYFYGIITEKPEGDYYGSRTPGSIWMDLYMREFALPDDLSAIPLQGYRGSYAVLDLTFADRENSDHPDKEESQKGRYLSAVYAIKVIHGEEISCFRLTFAPDIKRDGRGASEDSRDESKGFVPLSDLNHTSDYEQLITDLDHFLGHLSLVVHDISEEDLSALREDYGMILGKTLSNHIIDTRQMAENHIPFIKDYSINGLADHMGIDIHLDNPCEERCRITWQLYQRMERSELEKKTEPQEELVTNQMRMPGHDTLGIKISKVYEVTNESADSPLIDIPMTESARRVLLCNKIDTLRELSRLSAFEVRHLSYMDEHVLEELKTLLSGMSLHFRPENEESFLYGYPEHIYKTIEEKKDYWEYVLFYEALAVNFSWLEHFSSLRTRDPLPKTSDRAYKSIDSLINFKLFVIKELASIQGFISDMADVVKVRLAEALGQSKEAEDADPKYIVQVAEDLIKIYKSLVHWIEDMHLIETDSETREGMEDFIGFGEDICKTFDDLHQQAIVFADIMKKYYDGEIGEDEIPKNMTIKMNLEDDRIEKIVNLLREEIK